MEIKEPHTAVGNPDRRRTAGGIDPKSVRARIATKARTNPKEKFDNLLHHVTPALIGECLKKTPLKSASGVDGMTVGQARDNLDWLLPPIMKQIHQGCYDAPPVRRVYIPKPDGKQRPIGVPQVIDRAIQAATAEVLNEIYEQDFLPCSFGFRPGIGCHHALATVSELIHNQKMNFALEIDIRDFFGSLDHGWLRRFLELRIGDKRILALIEAWLKAGVMERGVWQAVEVGTPQGGSISPLLANVYLHYVLDLWFERKIRRRLIGRAVLVRYADDFVILAENQKDIATIRPLLAARLAQFGLAIAEEKSHETDLTPRNRSGGDRRHIAFLGFDVLRAKRRSGRGSKVIFQTQGRRLSGARERMKDQLQRMMHWELADQARYINVILRGHFAYYGMAGNFRRLQTFYWEVLRYWRRCLSKRSQNGQIDWARMNEILGKHPLVTPRIYIRYGDLAAHVRL